MKVHFIIRYIAVRISCPSLEEVLFAVLPLRATATACTYNTTVFSMRHKLFSPGIRRRGKNQALQFRKQVIINAACKETCGIFPHQMPYGMDYVLGCQPSQRKDPVERVKEGNDDAMISLGDPETGEARRPICDKRPWLTPEELVRDGQPESIGPLGYDIGRYTHMGPSNEGELPGQTLPSPYVGSSVCKKGCGKEEKQATSGRTAGTSFYDECEERSEDGI